jgi:hypothetical protein
VDLLRNFDFAEIFTLKEPITSRPS